MIRGTLAAAALAALAGCTVGPDYHRPDVAMPKAYQAAPPASAPVSALAPADLGHWWRNLHDPKLDALIHEALAANYDLRIANERLAESRAQRSVVVAGLLPELDSSLGLGRGSGTNSVRGRIDSPLNTAVNTRGVRQVTKAAGFDATWEVDLFGHVRRQIEAATDDVQALAEARNALRATVAAEVARDYVELRSLQARLAIARRNTEALRKMYGLVNVRNRDGLASQFDVGLAQRQYQASLAALAPLAESADDARRRLAVLLGRNPEELAKELSTPAAMPSPGDRIAAGLPSELLRNRPDIREAERQLAAANARVGVAVADYFPQVTLLGALGYQAQGLSLAPSDVRFIYSYGPGVRWPILDFGKIDAAVHVQDARTREALLHYEQTIKLAVLEVENAIGSYIAQRDQLARLRETVGTSGRVLKLATERYQRGLTDFLNVLDAQRQLYALQDEAEVAQAQLVTQWIAVNKALGGGWQGKNIDEPPAKKPENFPPVKAVTTLAAGPAQPRGTDRAVNPPRP